MSKVLGKGRYLQLWQDAKGYEFVERTLGSGVVVIAACTEGHIVLVEQYRAAIGKKVIELPAGLVGDETGKESEAFEEAARRELWEETGYEAGKMEFLLYGPPSAGLSSEMVHFYYASQLSRTGPGGGDERENIQVHVVPLKEVELFCRNRVVDPKVYAGVCWGLVRERA